MPQSGLFSFIEQAIANDTISSLPMGKKHKLKEKAGKPPFYLLISEDTSNQLNPFSKEGFALGEAGHIRIDSKYTDSLHNRTISYCHGTEYFIQNNQTIIVHYYFDRWGHLTQFNCVLQEQGFESKITASRKQRDILFTRAATYSDGIEILLNKRQEKILKLSTEIEALGEKILIAVQKHNRDLTAIITMIQQRLEIIKQKNAICDQVILDNKDDFFACLLQNLNTRNDQDTQLEAKVQLQSEQAGTTVNQVQQSVAKPKPGKKKPDNVVEQLRKSINILKRESEDINNYSASAKLSKYVEDLIALRVEILSLANDSKLYKELDHLKTEMKLYTNALEQGNLEQIKILFPYCKHNINIEMYNTAVFAWIINARENSKLFAKKLEIFDYLHENCGIFNAYIRTQSTCCFEADKMYYSMMYLAYLTRNPTVFSALLRYGANPDFFWRMDKKGKYTRPMHVIVEQCFNSGFYVEELVRYGVTVQTTARKKLIPINEITKYKNRLPISEYRKLENAAQEMLSLSRVFDTSGPRDYNDISRENIIDCPFIQFVYFPHSYNANAGELYTALVNNSSLDSLLIALPYVANNPGITPIWLTNSKASGLCYAQGDRDLKAKWPQVYGVNIEGMHNHLNLIYGLTGSECIDSTRTKQLIEAINCKLVGISNEELDRVENKILDYIFKVKAIGALNEFLTHLYTAFNILATARGNLTKQQQIQLIDNFVQISLDAIAREDKIRRLAENALKESMVQNTRLAPEKIIAFKQARQEINYVALNNLDRAINAAYYTCYPDLRNLPIVQECFDKATAILERPYSLKAEHLAYWQANIKTKSGMDIDIFSNKPWLITSEDELTKVFAPWAHMGM